MTAYELAVNVYENSDVGAKPMADDWMSVDNAEFLLREYRFADEDGELDEITAEDLANEYNALLTEHFRINAEEDDE